MEMNSTTLTIGVIVALDVAIGAAILWYAIKRALSVDNWTETPPFTYVPPKPPCKAIREAQDIVNACWSEEMQQ
jgi:hypothetical protein